MMTSGDIYGLLLVYMYVFVLIAVTEKIVNNGLLSRKILHVCVGNVLFILPLFDSRWVMTFLAAAPFVLLTYLISPYSPLKTVSKTSSKGHSLGLFYYAVSWTVLAFFFFERPEIIAVGIVAMSYGDGFASMVGVRYGKRKFNVCGDEKSIEGSITMFGVTAAMAMIVLLYYGVTPIPLYLIVLIPLAATFAEAITPKGLDNLTISISAAILYYLLF